MFLGGKKRASHKWKYILFQDPGKSSNYCMKTVFTCTIKKTGPFNSFILKILLGFSHCHNYQEHYWKLILYTDSLYEEVNCAELLPDVIFVGSNLSPFSLLSREIQFRIDFYLRVDDLKLHQCTSNKADSTSRRIQFRTEILCAMGVVEFKTIEF